MASLLDLVGKDTGSKKRQLGATAQGAKVTVTPVDPASELAGAVNNLVAAHNARAAASRAQTGAAANGTKTATGAPAGQTGGNTGAAGQSAYRGAYSASAGTSGTAGSPGAGGYSVPGSVNALAASLRSGQYTPRTEEELRSQAEAAYALQRDQARLSAQQVYDESDLALANQLNGLADSYARQTEAQRQANAETLSRADRYSLQRGMQRSSYNNATLANIGLQGDKALANIEADRTAQEQSIAGQRALLSRQLAQNLAAADADYEARVAARVNELRDQDYERRVAADSAADQIQMQLYQLGQSANAGSGGTSSASASSSSAETAGVTGAGTTSGAYPVLSALSSGTLGTGSSRDYSGGAQKLGADLTGAMNSMSSRMRNEQNIRKPATKKK